MRSTLLVFALAAAWHLTSSALQAELVAYYPLDGDALDATQHQNNAAEMLGGEFAADFPPQLGFGMSLAISGGPGVAAAGFDVPDANSLDLASEATISAWVRMTDFATAYVIASKGPSGSASDTLPGNYELRVSGGSGRLQFLHQTSTEASLSGYLSTTALTANTWTHVAVTAKAADQVRFYVNGQTAGSLAIQGLFGVTNDRSLLVGTRRDHFSGFNGSIDDLAIWNTVLDADAIRALSEGASPFHPVAVLLGDMNGDEATDNIDIAPFALALSDLEAFTAQFPGVNALAAGDINRDGRFDNLDIAPFAELLAGGVAAAVPEPRAAALIAWGAILVLLPRGRRPAGRDSR